MNKRVSIAMGVMGIGLIGLLVFVISDKKPEPQIGCTMEAMICSDGSAVGRSGPLCAFAPCPETPVVSGDVRLLLPRPNDSIASPLSIRGEARGTWYFEGSFPVSLVDEQGVTLGRGIAQAEGEWMTTEFVPFEATIEFTAPQTGAGSIVLSRDNPSGLPENDKQVTIPIRFR